MSARLADGVENLAFLIVFAVGVWVTYRVVQFICNPHPLRNEFTRCPNCRNYRVRLRTMHCDVCNWNYPFS